MIFQKKSGSLNYLFLIIIFVLIGWGFFNLFLISIPYSLEKHGKSWYFGFHQLFFGFIPGILIAYFFYKLNLNILKKFSLFLFLLNLILLILVFFPSIGVEIYGSRRWLKFGPFMFQPLEFLKVTFLVYLCAWLSSKVKINKKNIPENNWKAPFVFLTLLVVIGIILLFQPDFSSFGLIFLISLFVYFLSPTPWWHSLVLIFFSGVIAIFLIIIAPYRLARLLPLIHPQIDPLGIGYQLEQSLIALGSGGLFGIEGGFGLGLSRQKFGFLPHFLTDSVFAVIGEELGFLGVSFLVLLFLLFAWQGLKISLGAKNEFERLLAGGITFWIVLQAFFNIGGIIGILPLGGIPLPFFSYGASHFLTEMIAIGILLNISKKD